MNQQFQINRSGVINVDASQGTEFQCVKSGHKLYFYWCDILFKNPTFDHRGFLADHTDLDTFIQEQCTGPIPSCELMVQTIGAAVAKWLAMSDMPAASVYMKFASTAEGSMGFIDGTLFPSELDNFTWIEEGKKNAQHIEDNDSCEYTSICGPRRLKTLEEMNLVRGGAVGFYSISGSGHRGVLLKAEVRILEELGGTNLDELDVEVSEDNYYPYIVKLHDKTSDRIGVSRLFLPKWAITCAPLPKNKR